MYRRLAELRKSADEATQPDQAVETLLALADVEMQLGSPQRAAGALEEAVQRHGTSRHIARVLGRLASVYRDDLKDPAKAQACQQRLAASSQQASVGQ